MPRTDAELDALKEADATGTLRVSHEGRSVEYGSAADLLSRIHIIEAEMAAQSGSAAPVLHVSAGHSAQSRRRRLLLDITDGKPNDLDHYEGRHGMEDSRMASSLLFRAPDRRSLVRRQQAAERSEACCGLVAICRCHHFMGEDGRPRIASG
jgi:hypothetical protein